jgi:hypothetical protein
MPSSVRFGLLALSAAAAIGWRVWHGVDGVVAGLCFFYAVWWLGVYVYRTSGEVTESVRRPVPPWWLPLTWVLLGLFFLLPR